MSEILLDIAKQRFEQESSYAENIDSKASGLIGYSGVIATFIGFLFSANIVSVATINKNLLICGVIFSLLAILTGFIILVPIRKTRDIFLVENFVDDFETQKVPEQVKEALNAYLVLINKAGKRNVHKSIVLYIGNILLGIGIVISFISIFQ